MPPLRTEITPSPEALGEVSRRTLGVLFVAWRRQGGSPEALLVGQGLDPELSVSDEGNIGWATYAALLRGLATRLSPEAFRHTGHQAWSKPGLFPSGFWMRNFYTVVEAYAQVFAAARSHVSPLHQAFNCLETDCEAGEDGAVRLRIKLKPGYGMSREFFWLMQGVAEGLPRLWGLRPVESICVWQGYGIDLRLTAPTVLPPLAQVRRWLTLLFTPRFLSRELARAHRALQEKTTELETQLQAMTALKASEEAARLRADMASRAKNDFLTAMSHDLRTPLNGIVGLAEWLSESLPSGSARDDAATLLASSHDLRLKIDHLLDYAQLAHENSAPDWAEVDVAALVREVAEHHAPRCYARGLGFELKMAGRLPALQTDARRVQGVLNVFLENAVKHAPAGTVTLAATFDALAITLEVADQGPGLDPEQMDGLFAGDTARPGLFLAARLAESLHAMVGATSRAGHGAVFTLRLPLHVPDAVLSPGGDAASDWIPATPAEAMTGPNKPQPAPSEAVSPTGLAVLLVDDHALSRDVTVRLLRRAGHDVVAADSGLRAAKLCQERDFDIVLLDIMLPGMDGLATAKAILRNSEEPPRILAYTASVSDADRRACREAGFDGFLAKPVSTRVLLQAIETVVQLPRGATSAGLGFSLGLGA